MPVRFAKELVVYQKAYTLALRIFEVSKRFPPEERYALTSQTDPPLVPYGMSQPARGVGQAALLCPFLEQIVRLRW
jgi:hypothetical protein